jgi:hypothetical protein
VPLPGPLRRLAGRMARRLGLVSERSVARARRDVAAMRRQRDQARQRATSLRSARDGQQARADALAAELERVRAAAAEQSGQDRPDLSYLFVLTYGRSGSTLLQGILSATPGVTIRGENGGVIQHLFAFHDTVTRHRDRLARGEVLPPSHPWWGIDGYPDPTALRDIRTLLLETVLRPGPDCRVVGFKEIDWPRERLADLLRFIRAVFPGARFVLNTRDLAHVAASKWWARRPDAFGELQAMEQRYVAALDELGDDAWYRVHYDDWVADPEVLRGLFDWLGEPFDLARVRAVLDVPHSY